jgi:hypothetical protein
VLGQLDDEGIRARIRLAGHTDADDDGEAGAHAAPPRVDVAARRPLADEWDRISAQFPPDWSDVLADVQLDSTDQVELAALRLGPVNPYLIDDRTTFRFRVAHRFGYGAAPEMARRCLARLDEEGISGRLRILRVLSDTRPVATQGPVWRIGGRSV